MQDIYFILNNENVNSNKKKAHDVFTQNILQHNTKHTLDHKNI